MTEPIQLVVVDDHTLFRRGLIALLSEDERFQIVGEAEADIERGLLNIRSPLARAMIGKDL